MKRIVLVATAAAVLIAATVAFAATPINNYTATYSFSPGSSGTAKTPQKTAFTQKFGVTSATAGNRAGILLNIKTTIYGLKGNLKGLPTCTIPKITAAGTDTGCPKGALVAKGSIAALLGSSTNFLTSATAGSCNPNLDVWNAGPGKLAYFFVPTAANTPHACLNGAIKTGQVPPYPGTYKQSGKNLVLNTPIPATVDYPSQGLVGSLQSETLTWKSSAFTSVACQGSKRAYSTVFTATLPGQSPVATTVPGSAPCKTSK